MGVSRQPLVSCVMPTRERRTFAAQAIWYFLRQDYAEKELLVLDDGDDRVEDLTRGDERIRYVHLPRATPVGEKRELGCELARGELVAHWDDDDWIGPTRLSEQVAALQATGAVACAARELMHYRLDAGDAWLLRCRWPDAPDLPPGTLLHRRTEGRRGRFASTGTGEGRTFFSSSPPLRVHAVSDPAWYLAVVHRANATATSLDDGRWHPCSFAEAAGRLGPDRRFYARLRNGNQRAVRGRAARHAPTVTVSSFFRPWDGYGLMAEYLALGMARAGAQVSVAPLGLDDAGLSDEFRALLAESRPAGESPALWFAPPHGAFQRFPAASDLFINTMWESDRLPRTWINPLNRARAVIVPTRFVADVCRRSGVESPIEVVPEGVDPELYPYVERPEREQMTTLLVGPLVRRKHVAEAIAAWRKAFGNDPAARLILKGKLGVGAFEPDDPRISVTVETERTRGIAHWYSEADVLLALGNEGFGLPLVEAMSTGLPAIALSSEGQGDVCADAGELVLAVPPAGREPSDDTVYGDRGMRSVPDVDAVADRLRWVATHRKEARRLGRACSAWVHSRRNIWDKGPAVLDVMERRMASPRPLRRTRTLWPTDSGALRPYVSSLAEALKGVRVVTAAPVLGSLRLLHVQHPGSAEGDAALAARVLEASQARIPVVVTEHAVAPGVKAWERDAEVLVATTHADERSLRERWPGKWIELIPYGCPPYAGARKRRRRRVVAVCGDAARPEAGAAVSAARGARRRVVQLAPGQRAQLELARHLAQHAEAVVFVDAPATRLEVGAALAAGAPVVARRDARLADLDGAVCLTEDLGEGLARALEDGELRRALAERGREYCEEHSWDRVARRHVRLWAALEAR
jgi:glycosyltransferase involved in cell wall biosynthesis